MPYRSKLEAAADTVVSGNEEDANDAITAVLEAQNGTPTRVRVAGVAYGGGKMRVPGWSQPVVVDLAGGTIPESVPLLTNHENRTGARVGMVKGQTDGKTLRIEGEIVSSSGIAKGILEQAQAGADWQLSIGTEVDEYELVETSRIVNGQQLKGPFFHVKKWALREVSVIPVGADSSSKMKLAAQFDLHGGLEMTFEEWLKKYEIKAEGLSDERSAELKAAFEAGKEPPAEKKAPATSTTVTAAVTTDAPTGLETFEREAESIQRRTRLEALGVRFIKENPANYDAIRGIVAKAVTAEWTVEHTELELLRASRPKVAANMRTDADSPSSQMLEAALCLAGGLDKPETKYPEQILEQANHRWRHNLTMCEVIDMAARANGWSGVSVRSDLRGALRAAFSPDVRAAGGFSNIDTAGILSNVANKFLLEGFYSVERTWRSLCSVKPVRDFKLATSYRLTGSQQYELVAPGGELKHGSLGEESFTIQADTYGRLLAIDRRDIINDDLDALSAVPRMLGRGSGLKINDVFWTAFMDNATFFTAARANYIEGASTNLSITSLTAAEVAFMILTDADGAPTGVDPKILLVPPALMALGSQLFKSLELRDTNASTKYPVANPHAGKFRVEVSRYLSNALYTGYSALAWYLLAAPQDLAVMEVAFLNGQEAPTIESADADFDVLGIRMRGYHDFGVAKQEWRAGVKTLGEAE